MTETEIVQEVLGYLQKNVFAMLVISAIAGFAAFKSVALAKRRNPVLYFVVGLLGCFLGQFAILYLDLKGVIDQVSSFRPFFDLLAAYLGSFVLASLVNFAKPL